MNERWHDCPYLSVDMVCMWRGSIILIERKNPPLGLALPGGMVDYGETPEAAALRELQEETNMIGKLLGLVGVYGDPDRDKRAHIITIAYAVAGDPIQQMKAMDDAKAVHALEPDDALAQELIADHHKILEDAINQVFKKVNNGI